MKDATSATSAPFASDPAAAPARDARHASARGRETRPGAFALAAGPQASRSASEEAAQADTVPATLKTVAVDADVAPVAVDADAAPVESLADDARFEPYLDGTPVALTTDAASVAMTADEASGISCAEGEDCDRETRIQPQAPRKSAATRAVASLAAFVWRQKALAAILTALGVQLLWPDSGRHPATERPYCAYALALCAAFLLARPAVFRGRPETLERMRSKDLFTAAAFLLLALLDVLTAKATVLPTLFFPTPDRILAVLAEDFRYLIVDCLGSSAKLLVAGFFSGALAGLATGILIGFSRGCAYWLNPLIKFLGPIPPTAWIPIVLVAFPTTWTGAVFLIALSVWFPTSVMTSSGIINVQNSYFEVSRTLGAGRLYQIFRVGIPAAMPLIFTGLFSGACASFLTLMTAEMIGVKNGIGWYIHWQRQMLAYANVYAGLIVVALTFYSLITLFFKARDRVLVWQKGMIKW
ncbi:MAG: ABC transporter permease [Deltaproteobacteria bacterium]|jgi:NitT/TauT family transport system permease protein|nr:ABC transporter permease [Deltaproteobacteria bacterium]